MSFKIYRVIYTVNVTGSRDEMSGIREPLRLPGAKPSDFYLFALVILLVLD